MGKPTGPEQLAAWRARNGYTLMQAAEAITGDPQQWWKYRRWENGERSPSVDDAFLIESKARVKASAFRTKAA